MTPCLLPYHTSSLKPRRTHAAPNTRALVFLALIALLSIRAGTALAQEPPTVEISQHAELGDILTDAGGNTLYLFTKDERNRSNCSGGCAGAWPPLLTVGDPTAGEGVNAQRLETITSEDGSTQVAYNGWPLYYFARDENPGDTKGQYGEWFVVSAFGGPIQTNAVVKTVVHAESARCGQPGQVQSRCPLHPGRGTPSNP